LVQPLRAVGSNLTMTDHYSLGETGCAGCRRRDRWGSSVERLVGFLDQDLQELVGRLNAEFDGDLCLLALRGLNEVTMWMATVSTELGIKAKWLGKYSPRFTDLVARGRECPAHTRRGEHTNGDYGLRGCCSRWVPLAGGGCWHTSLPRPWGAHEE